ncbi:RING finger and CHY zinc finger domain-containing protein 1 [Balamuthia mandrillaris]
MEEGRRPSEQPQMANGEEGTEQQRRNAEEEAQLLKDMEQSQEGTEEWEKFVRKKIVEIQQNTLLDGAAKARRTQLVMSASWRRSQDKLRRSKAAPTEDELKPSYHEDGILGCSHYKRNNKIKADCCKRFFVCRLCHDAECDHAIDRHATKEMLCMLCQTVSPIGNYCNSDTCQGRRLAHYYCDVCKFHDDDATKNIYHCPDCGICRMGKGIGIDRFHCQKCGICYNKGYDDHKCVENTLASNCPICNEFMFSSRESVQFLERCGHAMHSKCLEHYQRTQNTCPICSKSFYSDGRDAILDAVLQTHLMPPEYAETKANIFCNDCEQKSTVQYHFMGHKCTNEECGSYNTVILSTQNMPTYRPPPSSAAAAGTEEEEEENEEEEEEETETEEEEEEEDSEEGQEGEIQE